MEAARGVDQHDLGAGSLRVVDGLKGDGCRILALLLGPDDRGATALRPGRKLVDRRRAEGVCRTDDDRAAVALEELRELSDGRRLADAVHADDEHDGGALGQAEGRVELGEVLLERLLQHPLQVTRVRRAVPVDLLVQLVDDPLGDVWAEVRREQCRLEVVPGRLIDGGLHEHAAQRATERPGAFSHATSLCGRAAA